jgi:Flp pilus assembly protein TadG
MTIKHFFKRLGRASDGSVVVEFALIGPMMIGLTLGVLHIGLTMHAYNAVRSSASDVARYAVVNYQSNNRITTTQLSSYAAADATSAPYLLESENLDVSITPATVQRIPGATELTMEYVYRAPSLLSILGVPGSTIRYTRPIFVTDA